MTTAELADRKNAMDKARKEAGKLSIERQIKLSQEQSGADYRSRAAERINNYWNNK
jgi:hypothetical protein